MKKDQVVIYQKLVRDKIPEIIKSHGKECITRVIEKSELHRAIGAKILEEAYELFSEWQKEKKAEILKESADIIKEIAKGFLDYFLEHPEKRFDYTELSKFPDPWELKIPKVVTQIKNMPLKFLSNTEKDYFILDSAKGRFHLKPEIHPYWEDNRFQVLVSERVDFLLTRYFLKQSLRQAILFDTDVFKKGFRVEKKFGEKLFEDKPLKRDEKRKTELIISNSKETIFFSRSGDGRFYEILYPEGSNVPILLKDLLKPVPKIGEKCFSISAKDKILRIEK